MGERTHHRSLIAMTTESPSASPSSVTGATNNEQPGNTNVSHGAHSGSHSCGSMQAFKQFKDQFKEFHTNRPHRSDWFVVRKQLGRFLATCDPMLADLAFTHVCGWSHADTARRLAADKKGEEVTGPPLYEEWLNQADKLLGPTERECGVELDNFGKSAKEESFSDSVARIEGLIFRHQGIRGEAAEPVIAANLLHALERVRIFNTKAETLLKDIEKKRLKIETIPFKSLKRMFEKVSFQFAPRRTSIDKTAEVEVSHAFGHIERGDRQAAGQSNRQGHQGKVNHDFRKKTKSQPYPAKNASKNSEFCSFCQGPHKTNYNPNSVCMQKARSLVPAQAKLQYSDLRNETHEVGLGNIITYTRGNETAALDTGSSQVVVFLPPGDLELERLNGLRCKKRLVVVQSAAEDEQKFLFETPRLVMGVTVPYFLVSVRSVPTANGKALRYLLGMDWIRRARVQFRSGPNGYSVSINGATARADGEDIPGGIKAFYNRGTIRLEGPEELEEPRDVHLKSAGWHPIGSPVTYSDLVFQWVQNENGEIRPLASWIWSGPFHQVFRKGGRPSMIGYGKLQQNAEAFEAIKLKVNDLIERGILVEIDKAEADLILSMQVVQALHKTTQYRLVFNFIPLNDMIKSHPSRDIAEPTHLNATIRKVRIATKKTEEFYLIDIKEAFTQILVADEIQTYQCVQVPWMDNRCFKFTRLGFGMSIAPKVLSVVLYDVLKKAQLFNQVYIYVDDMVVHCDYVDQVRAALAEKGFPTKTPEPLGSAKCLGLCISKGQWSRREPVPDIENSNEERGGLPTKRDALSWVGKLVSHHPIGGRLRASAHLLASLLAGSKLANEPPKSSLTPFQWRRVLSKRFDVELTPELFKACLKLLETIRSEPDPCQGTWTFDTAGPWKAYTDASGVAYGAVLEIGGVRVEDWSFLRKRNEYDDSINRAELKGLNRIVRCAGEYRQAMLSQKQPIAVPQLQRLEVFCDNVAVVTWFQKVAASSSEPVQGVDAEINLELVLKTVEEAKKAGFALEVKKIEGKLNPADPLSRPHACLDLLLRNRKLSRTEDKVVSFMNLPIPTPGDFLNPDEAVVLSGVPVPPRHRLRDPESGLTIPDSKDDFKGFLQKLHHCSVHPGADALYDLARENVKFEGMQSLCREVTAACNYCRMHKNVITPASGRPGFFASGGSCQPQVQSPRGAEAPRGTYPYERGYLDIAGPMFGHNGPERALSGSHGYVVAIVDSFSGFLWTRYSSYPPSAEELAVFIESCHRSGDTSFEVLHMDNGPQMTSAGLRARLSRVGTSTVLAPAYCSWYQGRVERVFRTLGERVKSWMQATGQPVLRDSEMKWAFERATAVINCTRGASRGATPHDVLYSYKPWIWTEEELPDWRPKVNKVAGADTSVAEILRLAAQDYPASSLGGQDLPQPGERWLLRVPSRRKFEPRMEEVDVLCRFEPHRQWLVLSAKSRVIRRVPMKSLYPVARSRRHPGYENRIIRFEALVAGMEQAGPGRESGIRLSKRGRLLKPTVPFDERYDVLGKPNLHEMPRVLPSDDMDLVQDRSLLI